MEKFDDDISISALFNKQFEDYNSIIKSSLPTNSQELQDKIGALIQELQKTTTFVSQLGLFSHNESFDELPTDSLKMMLLPVLLALLTQKTIGSTRTEVLRIASVYFKDYLLRCKNYNLLSDDILNYIQKFMQENTDNPVTSTKPDIERMSQERTAKLKRYHKTKSLVSKLEIFEEYLKANVDEEKERESNITLIEYYSYESIVELESIVMEMDILKYASSIKDKGEPLPAKDHKPLRLFLITKDSIQKKVYGAGYPSLPVMTVDEFYTQRVKDGVFPDPSKPTKRPRNEDKSEADDVAREITEEQDDPVSLESLRIRDDWRDTHRTGWGNTYNRS